MLKEKEKFYFTLILILVVGGALVWEGIVNGQTTVDNSIEAIQDKKITIGAYDLRGDALPSALESYNNAKKEVDKMDDLFVDDSSLPNFISDLEGVAATTSNSLEKVFTDDPDAVPQKPAKSSSAKASPTSAPAPKEGDAYVLKLTLNGNFAQLMNFVSKLESMPYYIYIKSISINTKVESSSGPAAAGKKKQAPGDDLATTMIIKVFKKQNFNGQK